VFLLAHEISRALVARRNGVAVDDTTLWPLGGVTWLRSETSTPGAERIAGVGPLVSLARPGTRARFSPGTGRRRHSYTDVCPQVGRPETISLRYVLTHMIEEYARHNGHADLLRQAIDGTVGE
jgi:hypothetical protein